MISSADNGEVATLCKGNALFEFPKIPCYFVRNPVYVWLDYSTEQGRPFTFNKIFDCSQPRIGKAVNERLLHLWNESDTWSDRQLMAPPMTVQVFIALGLPVIRPGVPLTAYLELALFWRQVLLWWVHCNRVERSSSMCYPFLVYMHKLEWQYRRDCKAFVRQMVTYLD